MPNSNSCTSPVTTPTATLINSSVPKKRVSRRHASHARAVPQRLHHGDEEREPHRHRHEQEVIDARERELDPCQVDVHGGSHVDAGARQLALDDPALLPPEGGRGPRAHARPRAVRARRRGRTGARRGRSRTRSARTARGRGPRRSPARGRRPRAPPCRSSGTARSRPGRTGGDPARDVARLLDRHRRQPGQRLPVGPGDATRRRRSPRSPDGRAGCSRGAPAAGRRGRARRRWPRRARRRTAPRARPAAQITVAASMRRDVPPCS